jgi:hypothetical protein
VLVVIGRAPPIYRDGADAVARRYDVDLASDDKARGGAKLDHGNLYSAEVRDRIRLVCAVSRLGSRSERRRVNARPVQIAALLFRFGKLKLSVS